MLVDGRVGRWTPVSRGGLGCLLGLLWIMRSLVCFARSWGFSGCLWGGEDGYGGPGPVCGGRGRVSAERSGGDFFCSVTGACHSAFGHVYFSVAGFGQACLRVLIFYVRSSFDYGETCHCTVARCQAY